MARVKKTPQQIEVGQRWCSRDRRDNGRIKEVLRVIPSTALVTGGGHAVIQGLIPSTVTFTTLRTRYTLVGDGSES